MSKESGPKNAVNMARTTNQRRVASTRHQELKREGEEKLYERQEGACRVRVGES